MKKLIFVRHGKAEDQTPEFSDFERSLTPKGKVIAKNMAQELKEKENSPGIIISSTAFRALETAMIFATNFDISCDEVVMYDRIYYKMSMSFLNEILFSANKDIDTITLFGHNPSFTGLTSSLSKVGFDFLPKCGIACLTFNVRTWSDIRPGTGILRYLLKPEKSL